MRKPGRDVEGVQGKEEGSEQRERVKTKRKTQTSVWLKLKRHPNVICIYKKAVCFHSFISGPINEKLLPHLATHLPHIPICGLISIRGSGSYLHSLLQLKSADSFLVSLLFLPLRAPVSLVSFICCLFTLVTGNDKHREQMLSCWGWWRGDKCWGHEKNCGKCSEGRALTEIKHSSKQHIN